MRKDYFFALAIVSGIGCKKATVDSASSDSSTAPLGAATSAAPSSTSAPAISPGGLESFVASCDQVFPTTFRTKWGFAGWKLNASGGGKNGYLSCDFDDEKNPARQRHFEINCKVRAADLTPASLGIQETTFKGMAKKDAQMVPSVGRWAMEGTAMGVPQIWIYDDKGPCKVTIAMGLEKGQALPTAELANATLDAFHAVTLK